MGDTAVVNQLDVELFLMTWEFYLESEGDATALWACSDRRALNLADVSWQARSSDLRPLPWSFRLERGFCTNLSTRIVSTSPHSSSEPTGVPAHLKSCCTLPGKACILPRGPMRMYNPTCLLLFSSSQIHTDANSDQTCSLTEIREVGLQSAHWRSNCKATGSPDSSALRSTSYNPCRCCCSMLQHSKVA